MEDRKYMRPQLKKESESYKIAYEKAINRLGEIFSRIMNMKNPKPVYDYVLESINELFYLTEMALKLNIEGSLKTAYAAVYGYESSIAQKMMNHEYPEDWMSREIKEEYKISKNGYLIDGVNYAKFLLNNPGYDILEMYDRPELLLQEREFPEQWHEADFFDFVIYDGKGNIIGYLEVNDNVIDPDCLPPMNAIEGVDAFSQIIGIIYKISLQIEDDRRKQELSNMISSILAKDLIPKLVTSADTIRRIKRLQDVEHNKPTISKSSQMIKQTIMYLDSITRIIEIGNRSKSVFTLNSIERLIKQWKSEVIIKRRNFKLDLDMKGDSPFIKVDNRFAELIFSILSLFDIVMEKEIDHIEIKRVKSDKDDQIRIGISSPKINDQEWKQINGFLMSFEKTRSSYGGGYLPTYIMNQIMNDYAGKIRMEFIEAKRWLILSFPKI